jgi:hypothetical protein
VKQGPVGGTYCRGSSQMKHVDGEVLGGYCVPQVEQTGASGFRGVKGAIAVM